MKLAGGHRHHGQSLLIESHLGAECIACQGFLRCDESLTSASVPLSFLLQPLSRSVQPKILCLLIKEHVGIHTGIPYGLLGLLCELFRILCFGDLGRPKLPKNKKNPLSRPNLRTVRGSLPLASEAEPERMPLGLGRAQCARRPSSQPSRKLRAGWERPVNLRPRKTSCHAGIVYSPANEYETKKSSPKRRLHPKKRFFLVFCCWGGVHLNPQACKRLDLCHTILRVWAFQPVIAHGSFAGSELHLRHDLLFLGCLFRGRAHSELETFCQFQFGLVGCRFHESAFHILTRGSFEVGFFAYEGMGTDERRKRRVDTGLLRGFW